jgi:hypothetical protein
MKPKHSPIGRVERVVTSIIFLALFLYLMFLVVYPLATRMGLVD